VADGVRDLEGVAVGVSDGLLDLEDDAERVGLTVFEGLTEGVIDCVDDLEGVTEGV
jgi:hypothetical protein